MGQSIIAKNMPPDFEPNSTEERRKDQINEDQIASLNVPDNLKTVLRGLLAIRDRFEEIRKGSMWLRLMNTILIIGYKDYREEWIKLFAPRVGKQFEPVKGVYDDLQKRNDPVKKSDFIVQPCEGCNTQELAAYKATGELPKRLKTDEKPKKTKDILEAKSEDDVLNFFGRGQVDDTVLMINLKAFAESQGIEVHANTKRPEKVANQILDMLERERG